MPVRTGRLRTYGRSWRSETLRWLLAAVCDNRLMRLPIFMPQDWRTELWHVSISVGQEFRAPLCVGGWFEPGWDSYLAATDAAAPEIRYQDAYPSGWVPVEGRVVKVHPASGVILLDFSLPAYALADELTGLPSWAVADSGIRGNVRFVLDVFEDNPEEDDAVAEKLPAPCHWRVFDICETDDEGNPRRRVQRTAEMEHGGFPWLLQCELMTESTKRPAP